MPIRTKKIDVSSDFTNAIVDSLIKDIEDTNNLISGIQSFCMDEPKNKLKGSSYDLMREKLVDRYIPLLESRAKLCQLVVECIQDSCNKMFNFFGDDYDDLNDALLIDLKVQYQQALNSYYWIKNILDSNSEFAVMNMDTFQRRELLSYYSGEMDRLSKLITKLENLAPTDSAAYGIIENSKDALNNYSTKVNDFNVTVCIR